MCQIKSKIPNLVVMVRRSHFGFNVQTGESNTFQKKEENYKLTQVQEEFDIALATLRKEGIQVKVFDDQEIPCPDAIFPNNWLVQIPENQVTIFPMLAENRRLEVRTDIVDWVMSKTEEKMCIDLRENMPRILEGTGSIVFDHFNKIAYAAESPRTNMSLFERYCEQIAYSPFSFESVDLYGDPIYHTNVMMSIAEKYAIVNEESILNGVERIMLRKQLERNGQEVISISYAQMNAFAGNVFEVLDEKGHSKLVMSNQAYSAFSKDQLEQIGKYSSIVQVHIPTIQRIGGGGIRCMMMGLFV